jgi:hypothetical protein
VIVDAALRARDGSPPVSTIDYWQYLPEMGLGEYRDYVRQRHPSLAPILDLSAEAVMRAHRWLDTPNEFDDDSGAGRGD